MSGNIWNLSKSQFSKKSLFSLTFEVILRAAAFSAQPLEERAHHLGTAEALEAGTHVLVVPLQSADLEDPVRGSGGDRITNGNLREHKKKSHDKTWVCLFYQTRQEQECSDRYGEQTKRMQV